MKNNHILSQQNVKFNIAHLRTFCDGLLKIEWSSLKTFLLRSVFHSFIPHF